MSPNWSGVDKVTLFSFGGTNAGLGGTGAFYSMDNLTVNGYPIDARSLRRGSCHAGSGRLAEENIAPLRSRPAASICFAWRER